MAVNVVAFSTGVVNVKKFVKSFVQAAFSAKVA